MDRHIPSISLPLTMREQEFFFHEGHEDHCEKRPPRLGKRSLHNSVCQQPRGPVSGLGLFDYIDEYLAGDFVAQDNGGLLTFDQQAQIIVKGGVI